MSELEQIKADIADTKVKLSRAEAEGNVLRRDRLESLLIEQQKEKNILLAGAGNYFAIDFIVSF